MLGVFPFFIHFRPPIAEGAPFWSVSFHLAKCPNRI